MNIRRYRPSDRGAVIGLFRESMWELAPPALGAPFQSYIERAIQEELGKVEEYYFGREGQGFWVAGEERILGMVGVEKSAHGAGELRRMAVEKAHRRKGIGRELLATAEAFCRECGYRRVVLSTSELQAAAMRLYESSGYRRVREETAAPASHKSVGAGLTRYHYEKALE
ncbi:MAG TPA: GNAT family N-acetyltransferase [Burkholderiales bacterium]|nr:GNAT family N-acetyltransferase [Burkholderiales bacterium]